MVASSNIHQPISNAYVKHAGSIYSIYADINILDFADFLIFVRLRAHFWLGLAVFMSIAEFEEISLALCIGGLVSLMIFILYKLGKDSGAGKFGTFVLFVSLGMGIFGFAAKSVIKLFIDI